MMVALSGECPVGTRYVSGDWNMSGSCQPCEPNQMKLAQREGLPEFVPDKCDTVTTGVDTGRAHPSVNLIGVVVVGAGLLVFMLAGKGASS